MRTLSDFKELLKKLHREAKTFKSTVWECSVNTQTLDSFLIGTLLEKNNRYESFREDLATKFLSVLVKHISQHWAIGIISKITGQ